MLKAIYDKKEDIPQDFESLFTEKDGKYELTGIEGMKTQADIERLQEGNRKEREDHAATKTQLKELKEQFNTANDELAAFKARGEGGEGDPTPPTHEQIVELNRVKRELEVALEENKEITGKYSDLNTTVTTGKIKDSIRKANAELNLIRSDAIENEIDSMLKNFELSDGKVLTKHDLDANNSLTPSEYLAVHVKSRPYLAPTSNSGGAKGSGTPQGKPDGAVDPVDFLAQKFNS